MGKRRHHRVKSVLPVRVFGMDSLGKPFAEVAHTLDVSHSGVRLGGFSAFPEVGSVLSLQCHHRKAQFTVAWVGRPGSNRNQQIGLKSLEPERDIFGVRLKDETIVDDFVASADGMDANAPGDVRRRVPRYLASGAANVLRVNSQEERVAEIQDVSLSGCYLKVSNPFKVGTAAGITLRLGDSTVQVLGTVTTCHPLIGMGLQFDRFYTDDDEAILRARMKLIEADKTVQPEPVVKPDTAAIAERLQKVTHELEDMDQLMQSGTVDPRVLGDFRDAISQVRTTAWALQRWMEAKEQREPFPVLSYLNAERIALATRLCESLLHELQKTDIARQKLKLEGLLTAVEKLFTRLAGIDFTVLDPHEEANAASSKKKTSQQKA